MAAIIEQTRVDRCRERLLSYLLGLTLLVSPEELIQKLGTFFLVTRRSCPQKSFANLRHTSTLNGSNILQLSL